MELYMLSPNDLNLYYTMGEVAECINQIYLKLIDLEYRNLKDSKEYHETIESLKISIKKENNLYSSSSLPSKLCKALMAYMMQTKFSKKLPNNIESIVNCEDEKSMINRRIFTKLQLRIMDDNEEMFNMMPDDIKKYIDSLGNPELTVTLKNSLPSSVKVYSSLEVDLFSLFLVYVTEYINDKNFISFKEKLITAKYMTSFIEPNMEEISLENIFDVNEETWIKSKLISDFHKVPDEIYNAFRNIFGIETASSQLDSILNVDNYDYYSPQNNIELALRGSILRAALSVISRDTLENLESDFNNYIASDKFDSSSYIKKIGLAIAKEAFAKVPQDKEKQKFISLRPNFKY